ncbi:hypothetical protein [Propionivibrio soli]|jgi:predicted membrane-bound spermidine synthase|uniref:hypothetical protein n=1 Tax=Propionivibrio soli TaxID=2976531 RepID=UPI0021E98D27|nr:hypothetical protein [Propionivibrio soli]
MNPNEIIGKVSDLSQAEQTNLYKGILSYIPPEIASAELGTYLSTKSPEEKSKAAAQFSATLSMTSTVGVPTQRARDRLWLIVVTAFALVLVGGFVTLAVGVFQPPAQNGVKPELILTTFTSVVGFLAGLFVPSPTNRNNSNQDG